MKKSLELQAEIDKLKIKVGYFNKEIRELDKQLEIEDAKETIDELKIKVGGSIFHVLGYSTFDSNICDVTISEIKIHEIQYTDNDIILIHSKKYDKFGDFTTRTYIGSYMLINHRSTLEEAQELKKKLNIRI